MRFLGFFFFWETASLHQIYAQFTHNLKKTHSKRRETGPLGFRFPPLFLPIFPWQLCFLSQNRVRNALAGGFIGLGDQMGINVRGGAHPGVAQSLGDRNAVRMVEI